ncbi:RTA1 like protein [Mollisia scopiformis]|uniref:RTA1 like protein n=1 Tax=Mollisia scopiformis TaxID=149040 RepID=A0A194XJZ6_MOLSC|nr:RTA1 like protein [Mollisia scopiformis]KUJ20461.1 RTA1 like protein [Mollisia scopiformis]
MAKQDFYHYTPSLDAAIVFAVLYTLAAIGTVLQFLRYRSWVWTVMVLASGMESAGYILRTISTQHIYDQNLYVASFSLIVLAPVLMAAACYIVFGRIVFHVVPKEARTTRLLWIPPRFVTPIFVACDVLALLLQLTGAVQITTVSSTAVNAKSKLSRGKTIAQIGVAVQLICFGLFSIIAVRFNFTSKRFKASFEERLGSEKGEKHYTVDGKKLKPNWQAILRVTNFASAMILIRSVYRMVDFSLGKTGYTSEHEWVMYVFDAAAIFPVVSLYIYWHPSKYLPYLGFRLPKHAR